MVDHGEQNSSSKIVAITATLCLLSAALGFAAEATHPQVGDVKDIWGRRCTYPSNPKSPTQELGFAAVVALLVSRVYCSTSRRVASSPVTRLSLIFSWVAWFGAMSFYVIGLVMTEGQGEGIESHPQSPYEVDYFVCKVVKPGIFGAGASFATCSILLHIIYFTHHHDTDTDTDTLPPSAQRSEVTMF